MPDAPDFTAFCAMHGIDPAVAPREGRRYWDRVGDVWGPVTAYDNPPYVWRAKRAGSLCTFTKDGTFWSDHEDRRDLIAEIPDPQAEADDEVTSTEGFQSQRRILRAEYAADQDTGLKFRDRGKEYLRITADSITIAPGLRAAIVAELRAMLAEAMPKEEAGYRESEGEPLTFKVGPVDRLHAEPQPPPVHPFNDPDPAKAQSAREAAKPMPPREGDRVMYRAGPTVNLGEDERRECAEDCGLFSPGSDWHRWDIIAAVDADGRVTRTAEGPWPPVEAKKCDHDRRATTCDGRLAECLDCMDAIDKLATQIAAEVRRAEAKHPPMNSPHEGWSVIFEELEELREHVRGDTGRGIEARKEAIQVAAMGLRYALNLCSEATP